MAGSYRHCVDESGALVSNTELNWLLENGGDVYEAVEEMYGMIWFLAGGYDYSDNLVTGMAARVERARREHRTGLQIAPQRSTKETR